MCADSLGWSQPITVCDRGLGALLFSTRDMKTDHFTLKVRLRSSAHNPCYIQQKPVPPILW